VDVKFYIMRPEITNAIATGAFLEICCVTLAKRESPIMLIAGATVSGVMNLHKNPMNPIQKKLLAWNKRVSIVWFQSELETYQ